jgi:hypothetical protein
VVRRGGEVEWAYASATAGDHPPIDLVLTQAKKAAVPQRGVDNAVTGEPTAGTARSR